MFIIFIFSALVLFNRYNCLGSWVYIHCKNAGELPNINCWTKFFAFFCALWRYPAITSLRNKNITSRLSVPWKKLYLDVIPPVFDFGEVDSIRTNIHIVRSDPLVSVLPSLSSNSCDLHWPSHINLQPLFIIIAAGRPGANEPSATRPVKPRQPGCVILIPLRRSCDGRIFNSVVLQANRSVVKSLWHKQRVTPFRNHIKACYTRKDKTRLSWDAS